MKEQTEEKSGDLLERIRKLYPAAASPCFVYTSNIDGFALRSHLAETTEQVYEYHGDLETWQCSVPCSRRLWKAPSSYRFDVDQATMLAVPKPEAFVPAPDSTHDPRLESPSFAQQSFSGPLPKCPLCRAYARPSILMFNSDDTKLYVRKQVRVCVFACVVVLTSVWQWAEDNWESWYKALLNTLRKAPDSQIVIVEVGAGVNVPSLRFHGERLLSVIRKVRSALSLAVSFSSSCTKQKTTKEYRSCPLPKLVRINPVQPGAEDSSLQELVIPVPLRALDALTRIDAALDALKVEALL